MRNLLQKIFEEFITENIFKYTSKLMETPLFYVALYQEDEELISFPFVISEGERVTKDHPEYDQWYSRPADTGLGILVLPIPA
jgi:hypothetical protein